MESIGDKSVSKKTEEGSEPKKLFKDNENPLLKNDVSCDRNISSALVLRA